MILSTPIPRFKDLPRKRSCCHPVWRRSSSCCNQKAETSFPLRPTSSGLPSQYSGDIRHFVAYVRTKPGSERLDALIHRFPGNEKPGTPTGLTKNCCIRTKCEFGSLNLIKGSLAVFFGGNSWNHSKFTYSVCEWVCVSECVCVCVSVCECVCEWVSEWVSEWVYGTALPCGTRSRLLPTIYWYICLL
jgi:hypothetical protein